MMVKQLRWVYLLILISVSFQCQDDPILKEVREFEGTYRVDSVEITNVQTSTRSLFTEEATIILRKRQKKDTITLKGTSEIVVPEVDENPLYISKNLFSLEFVKAFSNNSVMNFKDAGQYYKSYWFPDLNAQRITFWTRSDYGQYHTVLVVKDGDKNKQVWTYIRAQDSSLNPGQSGLLHKEVIHVTRQ
jgi:hypothetical protein